MKKTFLLAIIIFLIWNCSVSYGFERHEDFLQPRGGLSIMEDYQLLIDKVFPVVGGEILIRVVSQPAFTPEWTVAIGKKDEKIQVVYIKAKKMVHDIFKTDDHPETVFANLENIVGLKKEQIESFRRNNVEIYTADIDTDTANLLIGLWYKMIYNTRYNIDWLGYDDEYFTFSMFALGKGEISGWVWSPDKKSNTGRLIEIAKEMAEYTKADEKKREEIKTTLIIDAKDLDKRINWEIPEEHIKHLKLMLDKETGTAK